MKTYKDELIKSMNYLAKKPDTIFVGQQTAYAGNPMSTTILDVPKDKLANYVADDSSITYFLYRLFDQALTDDLRSLFFDIEMPLVSVLAQMEVDGVSCDMHYLNELSREYSQELHSLESMIYELAGNQDFNINSTQQLAKILFDDFGLPQIKNRSTAENVLIFQLFLM